MKRMYSDKTLMGMTKADLVRQVKDARHNQAAAEERLAQQAENVKDWVPVKWIPCSKKLPKIGEEVLVYSANSGMAVDYYDRGLFGFADVTHWMPLPESPDEGGHGND